MAEPANSSGEIPPLLDQTEASRPPVRKWRWAIHLLLIGSYPLLTLVAGHVQNPPTSAALTGDAMGLLRVCAVELAVFGFIFGLGWLASRASWDDLLLRWRNGAWTVLWGIGYSVAIRVALLMVVAMIAGIVMASGQVTPAEFEEFFIANKPDVEVVVDLPAMREDPVYFWLTLTLVSFVVAGLREELWRAGLLAGLRALWPRWFGSRLGQIAGVALAAAVFGIAHLPQGWLAVFLTGFLGFALGLIMVMHRSIWPAVLAHGFFDATSLALLPWVNEALRELQPASGG